MPENTEIPGDQKQRRTLIKLLASIKNGLFRKPYRRIFLDMTNICNLRCPFCYNDWKNVQNPVFMTRPVFFKSMSLAQLVWKGCFYLSCSYEPTLHPDFIDLIQMIPRSIRSRLLLTTNLAGEIPERMIKCFAQSGLHQLNISIESFRTNVYEQLRQNARFDRFLDNLQRLTRGFLQTPGAPKIFFITVVSRMNFEEIPELLVKCRREYNGYGHEIRYLYVDGNNHDWVKEHCLSDQEWTTLEARLLGIKGNFRLAKPPHLGSPSVANWSLISNRDPILVINSEGLAHIEGARERKHRIDEMDDVPGYFKNLSRNYQKTSE